MTTAFTSATGASGPTDHDRGFFGHPSGLSTLFFTEMWERFSYYGMRALLILFMTASTATGGLGFDTATAGAVYGLVTSMAYLANLPGGWIADRLIGQQRAVLYGGILIAAGNFTLAVPSLTAFYIGLTVIVIGTGLLKPNVSAIVGQLYAQGDQRRDAGFSIFYMGINLGAFLAPLVAGYLGQVINWRLGFASAGVGMVIGLVQYAIGNRRLGDAGRHPAPASTPEAAARTTRWAALAGVVVGLALVTFGVLAGSGRLAVTVGQVADAAGYLLLLTVVAFFAWLFLGGNWTPEERKRLYAVGAFFLAAALFWSAFEQAGSTLNLFADRSTRTSVGGWSFPSSWFQSLNSVFIILFAPIFSWLWLSLGRHEPSSPVKFATGLLGVGAGFVVLVPAALAAGDGSQVSPMWLTVTYLLHTWGELCLSPVGLSTMTKLAPARIVGLTMGVWFMASSVGNYLGGRLASFYDTWPLAALFGAVGAFAIGAGLVMGLAAGPVKRLMGEVK